MSSYKDELIRRGIECRISRGRSGALIFYGDRHETDCRGAGMKRFSIGVDGDDSIIRDIEDDFYLHDYTKGYLNIQLTFDRFDRII